MITFKYEAMDATGCEIKNCIEANSEEEASTMIRQSGYFVTKISPAKNEFGGDYIQSPQSTKTRFLISPITWYFKISVGWFILLGGMIIGYFLHLFLSLA